MLDLIYGTLLGDASLMRDRKTYRLDMSHGDSQYDYLLWKASLIGCFNKPQPYMTGYGYPAHRIRYYNKEVLSEIYQIVMSGNKKCVTERWLDHCTIRSLAIWYQDDGSWGKVGPIIEGDRCERRAVFYVCGFDHKSIEILCQWLIDCGYIARITRHKGYRTISLSHTSTLKLWEDIAPYLFLIHKVDLGTRPLSQCEKCDNLIEPLMKKKLCNLCVHRLGLEGKLGRNLLYSRFKTTSLARLANISPIHQINPYWFDHSSITYPVFGSLM